MGVATVLAVLYLPSPAPPEALGLRPDELAATDCMGWFRAIAAISEDTPRLRVCSMSDTSADYLLQDAIRQGALPLDRKMSMPSIDSLAYWISRNEPLGLVVCDVGIAHQVQAHMAQEHSAIAPEIALLPYDRPVPVGLAHRSDDTYWGSICAAALLDCIGSSDERVQASLAETRDLADRLGIELSVVA